MLCESSWTREIRSEQYVAWITCKSRFFLKTETRQRAHWLSFLEVTAACRTLSRWEVVFALPQKWASNNQFRGVMAGMVADRYQSYFPICPVDEWGCGAINTAPAAQTINSIHRSGKSPSLVLMGGACDIIIPLPIPCHSGMTSSASRAFTTPLVFLFII